MEERVPVATTSSKATRQTAHNKMTAVGFEPTQLALVELESTPLDHSGKLSWKPSTSQSSMQLRIV